MFPSRQVLVALPGLGAHPRLTVALNRRPPPRTWRRRQRRCSRHGSWRAATSAGSTTASTPRAWGRPRRRGGRCTVVIRIRAWADCKRIGLGQKGAGSVHRSAHGPWCLASLHEHPTFAHTHAASTNTQRSLTYSQRSHTPTPPTRTPNVRSHTPNVRTHPRRRAAAPDVA